MVLGGVAQFFPVGLKSIILGVYIILFGASTALLEFQIPPQVVKYASFMFSFLGRGVCKLRFPPAIDQAIDRLAINLAMVVFFRYGKRPTLTSLCIE